jgi:hypothetical protein
MGFFTRQRPGVELGLRTCPAAEFELEARRRNLAVVPAVERGVDRELRELWIDTRSACLERILELRKDPSLLAALATEQTAREFGIHLAGVEANDE